MSSRRTNFGRNVAIEPSLLVTPVDTNEVLACLRTHRDRQIRVLGSLHSWSEAAKPDDVALDLRHFDQISLCSDDADSGPSVEVGAGCTVARVLDYLRRHGRFTLPVYGVVATQTIAGAISTATHGSGRPSMSHYVLAASVAAYDAGAREPQVFRWESGDQLSAVRCGLGCTGVLLSIRLRIEPDFQIEERGQWYEGLDALLAEAKHYPRSQFYLMPWSWQWYAQLRRPVSADAARAPGIVALVLRPFRLVVIDVLMHSLISALANSPRRRRHIPWLFRRVLPLMAPSGVRVIDDSRRLLTVRHDLFTHVECEIFVPEAHLSHSAALVEWALRCCGGEAQPPNHQEIADYFGLEASAAIDPLRGQYRHDYLVTFRRVLRDETMISMTSGESGAWYAISLITYQRDLAPFHRLTRFLAGTMARALGARPHWGKLCPLQTDEIAAVYPRLPEFRAHCASVDPAQVFVNDFARRVLGFHPPSQR
jgi:hypothetical protein